MNVTCPTITLGSATDQYLILNGIDSKKYGAKYMIAAKFAWQKLFLNTLYVVHSEWKPLKKGDPYNYIDMPKGALRLLSVGHPDKCGNIQPLYYNSQLNVIKKPSVKKCGCNQCDCGGLCEEANSLSVVTKELFTINNVTYYEKTWIKVCPNGDVLEYKEIPTKKYNDFVGNAGDFNNDFNDDFSTVVPDLANYDIVTEVQQRKLCAVTVQPCGCVASTPENEKLLFEHCGCHYNHSCRRWNKHCNQLLENINNNERGEIKVSECGTRIYFKPARGVHNPALANPEFLLVNWQSTGMEVGQEAQIPNNIEILQAFWSTLYYLVVSRNGKYGLGERMEAERVMEKDVNNALRFLNPLSLSFLSDVGDAQPTW
jgi:hypothetical protein